MKTPNFRPYDLAQLILPPDMREWLPEAHLANFIIDVVAGRGAGFSLEAPEGLRFLTRSRVFSDAEIAELAEMGAGAAS